MRDGGPRGREQDLTILTPCGPDASSSALTRHMDACVAAAVRLGVTVGTALALHAAAVETFGSDLARADDELVGALCRLLGLAQPANP